MQKKKITDYESFQNEINILMNLVSEWLKKLALMKMTYTANGANLFIIL